MLHLRLKDVSEKKENLQKIIAKNYSLPKLQCDCQNYVYIRLVHNYNFQLNFFISL